MILISAAAICAADDSKPAPKPAPSSTAAPSQRPGRPVPVVVIPKEAERVDDNTYRYTDKTGKKWLYRRTPFGIARFEEDQTRAENPANAKLIAATKSVEDGDQVRFERPGPFGVYRWSVKKSDLNEVEKAVWERDRSKGEAAARRASESAPQAKQE